MPSVRAYINEFLGTQLDNFLHKNQEVAASIQRKILQAEKERKELSEFENWPVNVQKRPAYTIKS